MFSWGDTTKGVYALLQNLWLEVMVLEVGKLSNCLWFYKTNMQYMWKSNGRASLNNQQGWDTYAPTPALAMALSQYHKA